MRRFVEGTDRGQSTLFPECLEDWICEDNPVRVIDGFNEGWIEFQDGGSHAIKGGIGAFAVVADLVAGVAKGK
jgi:hypothetical protein